MSTFILNMVVGLGAAFLLCNLLQPNNCLSCMVLP